MSSIPTDQSHAEPTIYDRHADEWWRTDSGAFRSLRSVHRYREDLLSRWLGNEAGRGRVIDIGCGGGFFCATLSALGAEVIGVDLSAPSLHAAHCHFASDARRRPSLIQADARQLPLSSELANGIVLADVLEHVADWQQVITEAARLVKVGGWIYVSTIHRTVLAHVVAIWIGEGLGFIPRGTHDSRMFIRPDELRDFGASVGLSVQHLMGERPRVWASLRRRAIQLADSKHLAVAYSALLRKR
ncbi:MAG: bifunctional 2-polyprenyl-6-hydroxyphenol methylase/3-demethylubiquinol 3-O-methyltransferase UbiG [Planctomycetota bacterium]